MHLSSLRVLTVAAMLATPAGAAPQDVLTLRAPGSQIGATFRDAPTLSASRDRGARVIEVQEKSPAATSGLRVGDLVTVFDGIDVRDSRDVKRLISETPPGRVVNVTVVREGRPRILQMTPAPGR